jgi:predicted GNAT family acetyltransferase
MIEVSRSDDATAFLEEAEELLLADEARHNLILGLAGTVRDSPDLYPLRSFWLARHGSKIVGAAMRTPPYNLVLARPAAPEALEALANAISEELPGVVGTVPESEEFAELWAARSVSRARTHMRQGVYALEQVETLSPAPGSPRVATAEDRDLVLRWWLAFGDEVLHEGGPGRENAAAMVDHRIGAERRGILLWEDEGEPVSFAGWGGRTPNGIRVGPVYTPRELRGRGYATALTAELSQRLLDGRLFDGGRRFCFLYTDLANPTSNAIYERIGYRRVAESAEVLFDRSA